MKLYQVLAEMYLIEYDQGKTLQALGAQLVKAARADAYLRGKLKGDDQQIGLYVLQQLERGDPTPHKEYVQWMARQYAAGQGRIHLEDMISTCGDALAKYDTAKKKKKLPVEYRDINKIKVANLHQIISSLPAEEEKADANKGKSEQVYQDDQVRIIKPLDEASAKYYGRGTKWCTAADNNNMYLEYAKSGSLFVILIKNAAGEKYQFHFGAKQFADVEDKMINVEDFWKRFPKVRQFFAELDESKNTRAVKGTATLEQAQERLPAAKAKLQAKIRNADYGLKESLVQWNLYWLHPVDHTETKLLPLVTKGLQQHAPEILEAFAETGLLDNMEDLKQADEEIQRDADNWTEYTEIDGIDALYPRLRAIASNVVQDVDKVARKEMSDLPKVSEVNLVHNIIANTLASLAHDVFQLD